MSTTLFRIEANQIHNAGLDSLKDYIPDIQIIAYAVGARRGGLAATTAAISIDDDDLVIAEFDNGIQWCYDKAAFTVKVRQQQQQGRGTAADGTLEVPLVWQDNAPSRGLVSGMLRLLGINIVKRMGRNLAGAIAARIEEKNGNVLYQCDRELNLIPFSETAAGNASSHYLLFLHGTGSGTRGSFLGLKQEQNGRVYDALYKKYNGHVIAYDHRTFTQDPVRNAIELLRQLPDNCSLDLLTHSRGGLVGEVLARMGTAAPGLAFTEQETELLSHNPGAAGLLADIATLHSLMAGKKIRVQRFVRVACPAAGTTLVSDRMDTLLNVLLNILRNIPGEMAGGVAEGLRALVMAVLDEKNDPSSLPGIECMRPESDFIKVLNFRETRIDSELFVIAGDALGDGWVSRLKLFLVDAFYREDNDLVVNTSSMKRGTPRTQVIGVYEERRSNVNHFSYFINATSLDTIGELLAGNNSGRSRSLTFFGSGGIQEAVPAIEGPVSRSGKDIAGQPVLYVLPGIMGSELLAGEDRIWLRYLRIATGGLRRLAIDAPDVTASGINGSAYSDLVQYFSNTHYVIPFAYDWRKSVFDAAAELDRSVRASLEQTAGTISFVVHSMGGLVLRAFAVKYPATWNALQLRNGFRVLMLGTPNEGSYEIPRVLLGMGRNINLVAMLDLTQNKKTLLQQFVRYPGLLNLLPAFGAIDFREEESWKRIQEASDPAWPLPEAEGLAAFSEMMAPAFRNFHWDPAIVSYIAGKDELTAKMMEIDTENRRIDFYGTPRGDGSVTWESIPAELKPGTYYVDARHGDLASYKEAFAGYRELLETGATALLSMAIPATRGGEDRLELMPQIDPALSGNEDELSRQMMGMTIAPDRPVGREVSISITHGDMGHALYPIVAGHFAGDAIVQAEQVLNRKLGGYFTVRYDSGNYPGRIGTHEIVLRKDARPKGGVIIGLGEFGSLTENTLYLSLKQALMAYVTQCREQEPELEIIGISTLLVGSGFGGLTIYSCVRAVMMAVRETNDFFDPVLRKGYPFINHIEIIELYQYKAVQAARIIGNLLGSSDLFTGFVFRPDLIKRVSGSQNRIPDDVQTDWWHRLKVYDAGPDEKNNGTTRLIRFSSITDKARNEEDVLAANIHIVDKLIERTAVFSRNEPGLSETLYEMLIPSSFKGYGSDLRNIVLIVDKETARYPWEMLHDAYGGSTEPIVTRTGFIRQLSTATYLLNSELSKTDNALVIGNPLLNGYYPDLPGAATEAALVAQQLKERHFDTTTFIGQPGADAIVSLYSKSYKVLHIAAHGVVDDKRTGQTGVVMGEGLIMTPADFKQIRYVPELVFINCCSLGIIDKEEEERLQRKYEVAAGVGTQLIEMGAWAVIVAGWEVDDGAAKYFSETLYRFLLNGRPFGEAVRFARKLTYDSFRQVNTWGAYQCYGDPFYTLRNSNGATKTEEQQYYDTIEAVNKLETFISKTEAATARTDDRQREKLKLELEAIIAGVKARPEWKDDAVILALIAEAYKEMDKMEEAIGYYETLFTLEQADYTFRTVEQYCSTKIRYTVECIDGLAASGQPVSVKALYDAMQIIDRMIQQLEGLGVKTSERLNMLASGYKAKATLDLYRKDRAPGDFGNLVQAAVHYRRSFEQLYQKGIVAYHPLFNWLQLVAVLHHVLSAEQRQAYTESGLLRYPDSLGIMYNTSGGSLPEQAQAGFWSKVTEGMEDLMLLLKSTNAAEIARYEKEVCDNYSIAWKVEGSPKKIRSVIRYLELLVSLLGLSRDTIVPLKTAALNRIAGFLVQLYNA